MIKTSDLDKTISYVDKLVNTFLPDVTLTSRKSFANERIVSFHKGEATREYEIELGLHDDPLDAAIALIKAWWADKTICRCLGFGHKETCTQWVLPY